MPLSRVLDQIEPAVAYGGIELRRVTDLDSRLAAYADDVLVAGEYALGPFCSDGLRFGEMYEYMLYTFFGPTQGWSPFPEVGPKGPALSH
jgi:hypothetical protein